MSGDLSGRRADFLITDDLCSLYGAPAGVRTNQVTDATDYYNRPKPEQGNRRQRRAEAAQKRRNKK